jgi:tetraacyldisaccharide 4'-kinase
LPLSRRSAEDGLVAAWQQRGTIARLLYPFSLVFRALVAVRRAAYRSGVFGATRLPVPVVIVGNLTVGGSGKTPLVIHLAQALTRGGRRPGIIARGYRGGVRGPMAVAAHGDPVVFGDEALVLARNSACPVFVGEDRVAAGRALIAAYPACDVILSDDGLQHYRLARDVEIAVFDARGVLNGWCLPAGPLREPLQRLARVDAVVLNDDASAKLPASGLEIFRMCLEGSRFHDLIEPGRSCSVAELAGKRLHAVAGIGSPMRFFRHLKALGLEFVEHPFPDHHAFVRTDLDFVGDAIVTTEKDAVKLASIELPLPVWVLPVDARLTPDLGAFLLEKLHGCSPA